MIPKKTARTLHELPSRPGPVPSRGRRPAGGADPEGSATTSPPLPATTPPDTGPALALVAQMPGVVVAALVDGRDGQVVAQQGAAEGLERIAPLACALWQAHEAQPTPETLHDLRWGSALRHHLILPVRHHPGLLLLAVVDREFGDADAVRWQMALARNQLG